MSWPDGERFACPHQSFALVSTLFSDWRRTVSSKFFDTQVPSISTEKLVLPRHCRSALSRLCCNRHSLLLSSCLTRIGGIKNPLCCVCGHPSHDFSHRYLLRSDTDCLRRLLYGNSLVQALESCLTSGAPWFSATPPSLGRGRATTSLTAALLL